MNSASDPLLALPSTGPVLWGIAIFAWTALTIFAIELRTNLRKARAEHFNTRQLIEHLSEGIYRSSFDGRQLSANPALVRLNGYDNEAEMLAGVNDIGTEWYVEPGRRNEFRAILERDGRVEDFVSEIYRHKTRERIWVSEAARLVRDEDDKPLYYEGSVREITETLRRLKLEEQFQKLLAHLPGGLFQLVLQDGVYSLNYLSAGFSRITGLVQEEHKADPGLFVRLVHPDDLAGYVEARRRSLELLEQWDHEFRIRTPAGEEKWLRIVATPEQTPEGAVVWHGHVADVSIRKLQKLEIERLAFIDPLTQLPNRRRLNDLMEQTLGSAAETAKSALIYIDLDDFKALNDTLGHAAGDLYLVEIAGRLSRCLRQGDVAARIGGDEFVALLPNLGMDHAAATAAAIGTANRIRAALRLPFALDGDECDSSASIGVVVCEGAGYSPDELLKHADVAMYRAKDSGGDAIALYDPAQSFAEADAAGRPALPARRPALRRA